MVLLTPQLLLYDRAPWYRSAINALTSEQWSLAGVVSLGLTAIAGWVGSEGLFAVLLLMHCFCDTNDGLVYRHVEDGRWNGYGLYLDHICDALGAPAVALGGYLLIGEPWSISIGLVLFYLIAVHSWLYKIVQVSIGNSEGNYFWVELEAGSRFKRLGPDDLSLILALIAIFRLVPLLIVLDVVLALVFFIKAYRAVALLRITCWKPMPSRPSEAIHAGTGDGQ